MISAESGLPQSTSLPSIHSPPKTFDDILAAAASLPPPGPDLYTARRSLWLAPRPDVKPAAVVPSTSRQRLEQLLSAPNAVDDDDTWNTSVKKVWNTLSAGGRLKRRLPMALIIKVIHAAWLRDETWPAGAVAPEPDDVLPDNLFPPTPPHISSPALSLTEHSSGVTAPWMVPNVDGAEGDNDSASTVARSF